MWSARCGSVRDPSFVGPRLSLLKRASWDEHRWSRHDGGKADSGCSSVVQGTGTADGMLVKGSVANRKCRRRGEHLGRARRVRLLSLTPQGNHWDKGISLEQATHVGAGLYG